MSECACSEPHQHALCHPDILLELVDKQENTCAKAGQRANGMRQHLLLPRLLAPTWLKKNLKLKVSVTDCTRKKLWDFSLYSHNIYKAWPRLIRSPIC